MVFDRGGRSPRLSAKLREASFDLLTHRKGRARRVAAHRLAARRAQIDGRTVERQLHDQPVRFLQGKPRPRQIVPPGDGGRQAQVVTSRFDLPAAEAAYRRFARWRQENFFQ